jgi:type IV pilus assembly protein PilW
MRQGVDIGRLQLQTQVQQELRAAADLVLRDLRRAAHWAAAAQALATPAGAARPANPHGALDDDAGSITYGHDGAPQAGFRLRDHTVQMWMGGAGWQALTDPAAVKVIRFDINVQTTPITLPCARACAPGDAACPPLQQLREAQLLLVGQAVHDPLVQRTLASRVALRNDLVTGHCPA